MRFRFEVQSIMCSKRMLLVAIHDHIYGFDLINMEKTFSRPYYPQDPQYLPQMQSHFRTVASKPVRPSSLFALGPRWLAFPGKKVQNANEDTSTGNAMDQIVEAAKYLSDIGYKTVTSYFSAESQPAAPSPPALTAEDISNFGNVIVVDVCSGRTIAHFRAHKEPLSYLAFDPSGTLLATAGASGCEFNIFQIRPSSSVNLHQNVLHIYTLVRGRTRATITDITFSNDSRWMAVSTSHGTTHIYAINPEGGPVNIHTHIPSEPIASYELPFVLNHPQEPKHMVLNVIERVKQVASGLEENSRNIQPTTAAMINSTPTQMKILVVTNTGILSDYNLLPHGPRSGAGEIDPKTLQLTIEPTFYWDVGRRSSWPQLFQHIKSKKEALADGSKLKEKSNDPSWLSNVEIRTHTHFRPLWAGPQFEFTTYRKPDHGTLSLSDQLMEPIHDVTKIEAKYKPNSYGSSPSEPSPWAELEEGIPSGPVGKDLKDSISMAISTRMHVTEKKIGETLVDSSYPRGSRGPSSSSSSSSYGGLPMTGKIADDKKQRRDSNPPPVRMESNPQNFFRYDDEDEE